MRSYKNRHNIILFNELYCMYKSLTNRIEELEEEENVDLCELYDYIYNKYYSTIFLLKNMDVKQETIDKANKLKLDYMTDLKSVSYYVERKGM